MRKMLLVAILATGLIGSLPGRADVVGDVHDLALRTARAAGAAPTAAYSLTIVDLAMFDAANAIEGQYQPYRTQSQPPSDAHATAAALGAGCAAITRLHLSQLAATTTACDAIAATLPAGAGTTAGRSFGEASAGALLAARQGDGLGAPNQYRPATAPGVYVPTPLPILVDVAAMKPFALSSPSQFRPGPPPALTSDLWTRDFNEVKAIGSRASTVRTPEQTATVMFWTSNGPQQYLDSIAGVPLPVGMGTVDRARFLALQSMAIWDASIALADAKYAYNFWRPVTAIRNGDIDGNAGTDRDPGWVALIDAPPHPEYPCAHCTTGAAVATIVVAALGAGELATPLTLKPADAAGRTTAARSWKRVTDFVPEIANARVWGGIHYRNSTEVGTALGNAVGHWIVTTQLLPR